MTEFGSELILTGDVKYIGEGEDPAENPYMKAYSRALKEVYQPVRLNPEDAINSVLKDNQSF
jgi:hypothetical protein